MFKIGEKYRETSTCLEESVKANLTILKGPKTRNGDKEYYCKIFVVKEIINPRTGEKFMFKSINYYWLGEDFLQNKLNRGRMYLRHEGK